MDAASTRDWVDSKVGNDNRSISVVDEGAGWSNDLMVEAEG